MHEASRGHGCWRVAAKAATDATTKRSDVAEHAVVSVVTLGGTLHHAGEAAGEAAAKAATKASEEIDDLRGIQPPRGTKAHGGT